ncbi:flagellar hook capping FlgD N-terminal domain-containing protein [Iodobacter sp. CM08]|uniref:flagellar hook capping FlgD N-terminal domain-containing protein n=1 Tax=Iodobacter sp. CM08 TaxID=3085902 RepID=UPI002981C910|nr:flagellar hook capping FlgD N-terminal domain-containing protein [Iodobacter sp. CM08]MDW5417383.1 flagellar hook capping FlgD N-terminal domain-containing protein [Iodobacter sp. CM08]
MSIALSPTQQNASPQPQINPLEPVQGQSDGNFFMTLLVAQIKNQNPLEPSDPSQFVNQLVQLNQMDNSKKMLGELKANSQMMHDLQVLTLGNHVGSTVAVSGGAITLGKDAISGQFSLESPAKKVSLVITGADQQRTVLDLGSKPVGDVAFNFDPKKLGLQPGSYSLAVETDSKEKAAVEVFGVIKSVNLSNGLPMVSIAGLGDFPVAAISKLKGHSV